nr:MAG TPA: hypothetical protein [Inoviridae sp.]
MPTTPGTETVKGGAKRKEKKFTKNQCAHWFFVKFFAALYFLRAGWYARACLAARTGFALPPICEMAAQ